MKYKINEIFYSIQGEGKLVGRPCVFVRFAGCNLDCYFCDTNHKDGEYYTKEELEAEVEKLTKGDSNIFIVLTGGEPTLQLKEDEPLFQKYNTQIETNGTKSVPSWIDFIAISPKTKINLKNINFESGAFVYAKLIYEDKKSDYIKKLAQELADKGIEVYIQPLEINGEMNIKETIKFVLDNPQFNLSLQVHKLIGVR